MHAVRQALGRKVGDLLFESLEILADAAEPVDHQEHIAERVLRDPRGRAAATGVGGTQTAELRHRLDSDFAETLLTLTHDGVHLGDGAPHPVHVEAVGDRADVRQSRQSGERAATEVEAVELHLLRGMGGGQRRDERADGSGLARLRSTHHGHVAGGAGQVHDERVAPLVVRPVDDPDRCTQRAQCGNRFGEHGPRQHLVEGRRGVEGPQPHLVGARSAVLDPFDHDVDGGAGFRSLLGQVE
ncbi:hypothetical protein MLGJGCBP_08644 [Rhodococcus sp. T7]|nr:hypothetical protein MLGJGCBP_08644 [Rhodococcus sp. T7]